MLRAALAALVAVLTVAAPVATASTNGIDNISIATLNVGAMLDSAADLHTMDVGIVNNAYIYAKPSDIATATGMDVIVTPMTITFRRGWYTIEVSRRLGYANVYLTSSTDDGVERIPIVQDSFPMRTLETEELGVLLPLEQALYLANAGWTMNADESLLIIDAPKATFWTMMEDFDELGSDVASASAMLNGGDETSDPDDADYSGMYTFVFALNHFDVSMLVPGLGTTYSEKAADMAFESLLTDEFSAVPADEKSDERTWHDSINDVGTFYTNSNSYIQAGLDAANMGELATEADKRITAVTESGSVGIMRRKLTEKQAYRVEKLDTITNGMDKAGTAVGGMLSYLNAMDTAGSVSSSYLAQLDALRKVDESSLADKDSRKLVANYKKRAKKMADASRKPLQEYVKEQVNDKLAGKAADYVTGKIPYANAVMGGYKLALTTASFTPGLKEFLKAGDDGTTANQLINIATIAYAEAGRHWANCLRAQSEVNMEEVALTRTYYLLAVRAMMRFYDLLYGLRRHEYYLGMNSASGGLTDLDRDKVNRKFDGSAIPKQWAQRARQLRMTATLLTSPSSWASAGYDGAIELRTDFSRFYNDSYRAGPLRTRLYAGPDRKLLKYGGTIREYGDGDDSGDGGTGKKSKKSITVNPFDQGGVLDASDFPYTRGEGSYALALERDGTVKQWDTHGDYAADGPGVTVKGLPKISAVYGDNSPARYAVDESGQLWAWGSSSSLCGVSSLGTGVHETYSGADTYSGTDVPAKVIGMDDVKQVSIACGTYFALQNDGTVWTWGKRYSTSMGDTMTEPVRIESLRGVKAISAQSGMSLIALQDDGSVVQTVCDYGDCDPADAPVEPVDGAPDDVALLNTYEGGGALIDESGGVWTLSYDGSLVTASKIDGLSNIRMVYSDNDMGQDGTDTKYALDENGSLWGWSSNKGACAAASSDDGDEYSGAIGDGTCDSHKDTPVKVMDDVRDVKMSFGGRLTYALKTDGTVWTWGSGEGTDPSWNRPKKVAGISNGSRLAHHHVVLSNGKVQRLDFVTKQDSSVAPYTPIKSAGTIIKGVDVSAK